MMLRSSLWRSGFVWFSSEILTVSTRCETGFTESGNTSLEVKEIRLLFVCLGTPPPSFHLYWRLSEEACLVRREHLGRVSRAHEFVASSTSGRRRDQ